MTAMVAFDTILESIQLNVSDGVAERFAVL